MKRLKKVLSERDDSYYTLDAFDKRTKNMEEYLRNNGWIETSIGLWTNSGYKNIKFIDTNAGVTIYIVGFTIEYGKEVSYLIADGYKINIDTLGQDIEVYSDNKLNIYDINGLEEILKKIK